MIKKMCGIVLPIAAVITLLSGCAPVMPPPPPMPADAMIVPAIPWQGAVWVRGHWQWHRWQHRHVWVPGHWKGRRGHVRVRIR